LESHGQKGDTHELVQKRKKIGIGDSQQGKRKNIQWGDKKNEERW